MSAYPVTHVLEKCKFGPSLRQGVASWLEALATEQSLRPLLMRGAAGCEAPLLGKELHRAAQQVLGLDGPWLHRQASALHKDLSTYGEGPLQEWEEGTLLLSGIEELSSRQQRDFLSMLEGARCIQERSLLLLFDIQHKAPKDLAPLGPFHLDVPPLHQRHADVDRQICLFAQRLIHEKDFGELEGFSLEATAHIHRAVLQTERSSGELYEFLDLALSRAQSGRLPLHGGYIVTWPTVRLLEDTWDYRLQKGDPVYQSRVECDFQERLFSASVEHASVRSGFSQDLIELQCQLLQRLIDELPEHQRNYQGLTSRVDQLQWLGMKLLSQARTQAELRDFFGFGGKGKIPKATAKLKFDQYDLEHYGYRSTDPLPWRNQEPTPMPLPRDPSAAPARALKRDIVEIEGELSETLFWRHQDLFTVLGADALTSAQIAQLMEVPQDQAEADLEELVRYDFLARREGRYVLSGDDIYYKHSHSRLRHLEDNLLRHLDAAFETPDSSILENWFLRLSEEGLPQLRESLLQPFIHEQFLPLSDAQEPCPDDQPYDKEMYVLMLLGTHRLSPQVHGRLPLEERILYYFREASLQRADRKQRHQAICLSATQMLTPAKAHSALDGLQGLRKQLKQYLPHGRGNKPNFNLTLCFTRVPLAFYRDQKPNQSEFLKDILKTQATR